MNNTYIYGLRDPRDWRIRYIGRTVVSLNKRLIGHRYVRNPRHYTRRENWIHKLFSLGLKPVIEFLQCVPGNGFEAEKKWIAQFREMDHDLVNGNDGGAGVVVGLRHQKKHKPFPQHLRERFREMYKGKPVHPNFAASWERRRGQKQSPELIEKRASKIRGIHHTEEHNRKIRETNIKTWADPKMRDTHREFGRAGALKQWAEMTPEDRTRWIELHKKARWK